MAQLEGLAMTSFNDNQTSTLEPDGRRKGIVVGLRATGESRMYSLPPTERRWVMGSGSSCDVVLDDPYVSDMHCVLERRAGGSLVVRDKRSRNGTRVDGNFVEGAELRIGSYLTVGRTTLVAVSGPGSADESALVALRGHDAAFRATIEQALRAAQTDCNVLIVGETGTGKDLLARVIHEGSRRAAGKYVPVNCGGIPRELIGSELFGHERGAFTGAHVERDGYFVEAHGGSLFLDELGELPLELQPHLLRAIESRRVRRVGGTHERDVDVRIIAATNRLEGLGTESSRLRVVLYHRIATVVLVLPPLRERMGDVVELVEHMLEGFEPEHGTKRVSEAAWKALITYNWPGNVRELRHAVARAVALGGDELQTADFFPELRLGNGRRTPLIGIEDDVLQPYHSMMKTAMEQALATHGSIRAAAEFLGIPKSTFADRAKAWGLLPRQRPRHRFRLK
jgi:transcriptional regulator with PAS, ATPase and Fis domain